MTKDDLLSESFRLIMTALVYVAAAMGSLIFSLVHSSKGNTTWMWVMWAVAIGLLALAYFTKRESTRLFDRYKDIDDDN